ncbi:MAG: TIGR02597 family protein [Verrucomicrobiota bacterium]|nr:TIGR02597 family protein [Verrucomicrobiota bacterium]MEC8613816.1 TIGR02597 family protein [Verrucomicrobiota bacterium]
MNIPQKTLSLLAGASLFVFSNLSAVETDPVGYVTTTAADGSDSFIGLSLTESVAIAATASDVTGSVVSTASALVEDAYNSTHYLLFTSGAQEGQWYEITDTTTSSVVLSDDVATLGATASDEFKIIKFWTLGELLPSTSGFAVSTNVFLPVAEVIVNNLTAAGINLSSAASYFYHDGSSGFLTAGWFQSGTLAAADSVILTPETYFTVRNQSGSDFDIVVAGAVPVDIVGSTVSTETFTQDNQLVNPYPSGLPLDSADLTSVVSASTNVFAPGDEVILFESTGTTINRSSVASYFYHDGSSGFLTAGWYQTGSLTPSGSVEIPAGGAFWIRKAGASEAQIVEWNPPVPYTL